MVKRPRQRLRQFSPLQLHLSVMCLEPQPINRVIKLRCLELNQLNRVDLISISLPQQPNHRAVLERRILRLLLNQQLLDFSLTLHRRQSQLNLDSVLEQLNLLKQLNHQLLHHRYLVLPQQPLSSHHCLVKQHRLHRFRCLPLVVYLD